MADAENQTIHCRIGTRGSPLALAQAHEVRSRLMTAHDLPMSAFEIVTIKTEGDRNWSKPLAELGGKELFTREIEDALAAGDIDCAVHSAKDMPTELPEALVLDIFLPREDTSDRLLTRDGASLADLPTGSVLGTSSLRRAALIRHLRPDIHIVDIRGNVDTRMSKVHAGSVDATILASAGLNRLSIETNAAKLTAPDFPPAPGQGAIAIERRATDDQMGAFLAPLNHEPTKLALVCERAFLARLDGSCRTPMAAHAQVTDDRLTLNATILGADGKDRLDAEADGAIADAHGLGERVADELLARGARDILDRPLNA
ncbi:MAG: hydroxymethylbilane synthase, partial [Pseudomonadota bacterium]